MDDVYVSIGIGEWIAAKYRKQAQQKGVYQAALNMKKQGFPIFFALKVLALQDSP